MSNVSRRKLLEGSIGAGLAGLALPAVAVPANKPRHWDATYDVVIHTIHSPHYPHRLLYGKL